MNVDVTQKLHWDELILNALREDIPWEDVSANSVVNAHARGRVDLICKQDGVIAGLSVFVRTFALLDETAEAELSVQDGDEVNADRNSVGSRRECARSFRASARRSIFWGG